MAEGLSYVIWGLGRGYVSEKNLALDCMQMRVLHTQGQQPAFPWLRFGRMVEQIPSRLPLLEDLFLLAAVGLVLTVKASSGGRPEDSLVLHRPVPLPLVIPQPFN